MAFWWWIKTPRPAPSPGAKPRQGAPERGGSGAAGGLALVGIVLAVVGEALWAREAGPYLVAAGVAALALATLSALRSRGARS
jgi:hypothetical protein